MLARHAARRDLGAIRLAMGEKVVLGLEFFLAGDIVQTIVVNRTVIIYFLNLELNHGAKHGRA